MVILLAIGLITLVNDAKKDPYDLWAAVFDSKGVSQLENCYVNVPPQGDIQEPFNVEVNGTGPYAVQWARRAPKYVKDGVTRNVNNNEVAEYSLRDQSASLPWSCSQ